MVCLAATFFMFIKNVERSVAFFLQSCWESANKQAKDLETYL